MKTSILAAAAFVATTLASPLTVGVEAREAQGWHGQNNNNGRGRNNGGWNGGNHNGNNGGWNGGNHNDNNGGWNGGNRNSVFSFDRTFEVIGTPDQVVSNVSVPTGGLPGSSALFKFGINAAKNTICYNITLYGFRGEYVSAAKTATHIHEEALGRAGPPRLAFPNPVGDETRRVSYGCLTGPFTTGVIVNGSDTGAGFNVQRILDNPAGFAADSHSSLAVAGAMRSQLA